MAVRIVRILPKAAHGGDFFRYIWKSIGATKLFDAVLKVWGLCCGHFHSAPEALCCPPELPSNLCFFWSEWMRFLNGKINKIWWVNFSVSCHCSALLAKKHFHSVELIHCCQYKCEGNYFLNLSKTLFAFLRVVNLPMFILF